MPRPKLNTLTAREEMILDYILKMTTLEEHIDWKKKDEICIKPTIILTEYEIELMKELRKRLLQFVK